MIIIYEFIQIAFILFMVRLKNIYFSVSFTSPFFFDAKHVFLITFYFFIYFLHAFN